MFAKELVIAALIATSYPAIEAEPVELISSAEPVNEVSIVSDNDLYTMAHLLTGEAGADWCSDNLRYYVGSVVLNRVASPYFPDTIESVVFQPGQYECTWDGNYYREPSEREWRIAEDLLINGSWLPENVVFQAEFLQGDGLYLQEQNTYFCYKE